MLRFDGGRPTDLGAGNRRVSGAAVPRCHGHGSTGWTRLHRLDTAPPVETSAETSVGHHNRKLKALPFRVGRFLAPVNKAALCYKLA